MDGEENRSNEDIALVADYGPIRIMLGFHAALRHDEQVTLFQPPLGAFAPFFAADYYNQDHDKNGTRNFDAIVPAVVYRNSPLDTGVLVNFVRSHRGPEGKLLPNVAGGGQAGRANIPTLDRNDFYGGVYAKYNNGRFFLTRNLTGTTELIGSAGRLFSGGRCPCILGSLIAGLYPGLSRHD